MLPGLFVLLSSLTAALAAWAIAREMHQPRWIALAAAAATLIAVSPGSLGMAVLKYLAPPGIN